jgi:nicotinamidase-related amidase
MQTMNLMKIAAIILLAGALPAALFARVTHAAEETPTLRALYGLEPPRSLSAAHTTVVLVDMQNEFVNGRLPLPGARAAIARAAELAAWARRSGILVVLVKNVVTRPGSPVFAAGSKGTELVPELEPHAVDFVLQKSIAGAFSRTSLDIELRNRGIDTVIVGGFMTHLAVLVTANDGLVLGYRVLVAADATATRALPGAAGTRGIDAAALQRAALDTLADRVADVMLTRSIVGLPVTG